MQRSNEKMDIPIEVIFLDLGSTLIYAQEPWPPVLARADQELVRFLRQTGFPIESTTLSDGFDIFLDAYYAQREKDNVEPTTFVFLRDMLAENGYSNVPDLILRRALGSMYAVAERNWYVEEDAISTLASLREDGYRLGLISNTSDDNNVHALVDQCGFRPFFDLILTSAGCGYRKPHPRIFQIALEHFSIQPGQAVMVGDTLEADIAGANSLRIYSIWITRRAESSDPSTALRPIFDTVRAASAGAQPVRDGKLKASAQDAGSGSDISTVLRQAQDISSGQVPAIQPKAVIQALSELPALLARLRQTSP
jgi:HAD superfamily hydrolase (TIGR01662 family)